ncbi:MAG TPA: hypothetical protein VMT85_10180 [Thermoanaerobaculia bacterium]|nr:hypothetical protein [Thermoanaerobaculia bacterium]
MICERFQDLRGDMPVLAAHLAQCADCRTQLEVETELGQSLGALPQPRLPAGFETRLLERARTAPVLSRGSRAVLRVYALALLLATAAVLGRMPAIASGFGPATILGLLVVGVLTVVPLLALAPLLRGLPDALWRSISVGRTEPGALWCALALLVLLPASSRPAVAWAAPGPERGQKLERQAAVEREAGAAKAKLRHYPFGVASLVPELPDQGAILTPMQLATHSAGVRHYPRRAAAP